MKHLKSGVTALLLIGIVIALTGIVYADQAGDGSPVIMSPGLSQKPGLIQVISFPQGASVSVDGVPANGNTPVTVTGIVPGPHIVLIAKPGYADWAGNLTVKPGLKGYVNAALKPLTGIISVQSSPAGGTVFIDNVSRGTTDVVIPDIPSGVHQVRVEKSGYLNGESTVTVSGGRTAYVKANLKSDSGSVQVNSNPQGGAVSLDGNIVATSPALLNLVTSGSHTVTIKKAGYLKYSANVMIKPGDKKYLYASLEKTPKPGHVYNESNNGDTFYLPQNAVVQVRLPENSSTGFGWYITTTPGIEVLDKSFTSSNPGVPGAGGTATWLLKLSGTGTMEFSGIYKQGWMPTSGNEPTYTITVVVQ
ncbi:MAG: PEGA domain-containing protein [Methanomicrobiales archaeon]|nr:PEGA domain-containing protein [Methanomicrobiales archaeon]